MADPTVQVAVVSGVAGVISTMGVIAVAFINNRRERSGAAQNGVELTLRERITFRDEQIADLKGDVAQRDQVMEEQAEIIVEQRGQIAALRAEVSKLKGITKGKQR